TVRIEVLPKPKIAEPTKTQTTEKAFSTAELLQLAETVKSALEKKMPAIKWRGAKKGEKWRSAAEKGGFAFRLKFDTNAAATTATTDTFSNQIRKAPPGATQEPVVTAENDDLVVRIPNNILKNVAEESAAGNWP